MSKMVDKALIVLDHLESFGMLSDGSKQTVDMQSGDTIIDGPVSWPSAAGPNSILLPLIKSKAQELKASIRKKDAGSGLEIADNLIASIEQWQLLEPSKVEANFQTDTFNCLEDYRQCRDKKYKSFACVFAVLICIGERLIPFAGLGK